MELDDEASKKGASRASAAAYARSRALCGPVAATASKAHLAQRGKTTRAGHAQSPTAQTAKISKKRMAQTAQTTPLAGHMAHRHLA